MMEATLSAGLLGLMHKILNCQTAKPLRLDVEALRGARIADGERAANKLLNGAQRCGIPCLHPARNLLMNAIACLYKLWHWRTSSALATVRGGTGGGSIATLCLLSPFDVPPGAPQGAVLWHSRPQFCLEK